MGLAFEPRRLVVARYAIIILLLLSACGYFAYLIVKAVDPPIIYRITKESRSIRPPTIIFKTNSVKFNQVDAFWQVVYLNGTTEVAGTRQNGSIVRDLGQDNSKSGYAGTARLRVTPLDDLAFTSGIGDVKHIKEFRVAINLDLGDSLFFGI